jgi:hypothetical protein
MRPKHILAALAASALLFSAAACGPQQQASTTEPAPEPGSDEAMIQSAMSAAPAAVGQGAAIMAINADGSMRELRAGTNGYTCMPDNPATPGPDPMCGDANAMAWAQAWITHQAPHAGKVGFMYMLTGGTDASNTDPYATAPAEGNAWVQTGAHVMIVGATGSVDGYPRSPTPDTAAPYVMWPDTPYEHLMIPVQ